MRKYFLLEASKRLSLTLCLILFGYCLAWETNKSYNRRVKILGSSRFMQKWGWILITAYFWKIQGCPAREGGQACSHPIKCGGREVSSFPLHRGIVKFHPLHQRHCRGPLATVVCPFLLIALFFVLFIQFIPSQPFQQRRPHDNFLLNANFTQSTPTNGTQYTRCYDSRSKSRHVVIRGSKMATRKDTSRA